MRLHIFLLTLSCLLSFFQFPVVAKDRKELAFSMPLKDGVTAWVHLQYDQDDLPLHYVSSLKTPVCEDSLCYLVAIDVYWDLLGNFLDYKTPAQAPLTKFDHIEFTTSDHQKLKRILGNNTSILKDYEVDNLLDPEITKESEVVADAVAGATNSAIADEVVEGALYSTYTLWHIINGPISDSILAYTKPKINAAILKKMLQSDRRAYQYYALNHIPETQFPQYTQQLLALIGSSNDLVPYFAIEKLDATVWANPVYQLQLVGIIPLVPFPMQNEILNRLVGNTMSKSSKKKLEEMRLNLKENQKQKVDLLIKNP